MNSALKNRLVGTIIVVALVVIVLPEILDGEKSESSLDFVDIPPAPSAIVVEPADEFPQQTLDEQALRPAEVVNEVALDEPESNNDTNASSSDMAQVITNTVSASPAEPVLGASTEPQAQVAEEKEVEIEVKDSGWVVQLGSFRYEKNVNELIAKLKQAGYRAYTRPVNTSSGVLNKVFVGPELERDKLEQALPHLQEVTQLKGKITAFEVSAQ